MVKIGTGFFSTNNYGVYFYLIGSLLFFFQMTYENKVEPLNISIMLTVFIAISVFIVYVAQPRFAAK